MAGYTRQSVASIINGANITAPPLNAEFNQLLAAFSGSTGHGHTGGSGDAPQIPLATSVSGYLLPANGGVGGLNNTTATANPVVGDDGADGYAPGSIWLNTNGQKLFVNLNNSSGAAVWSQFVVNNASNQILPHTDNTIDLGSSSFEFKDLYIDGTAYVDSLNADAASIGTTLGVTGAVTFASTAAITGNTTVGGTLGVTGATTLSDNLTVSGTATVAGATTLNGNTTIGNASSDTVTVTAQVASDLVPSSDNARDLGSSSKEWKDLYIDGTANIDSLVADTADINGGSIDGTVIGGAVQTSGQFSSVTSTNLTASGAISFAAATISNLGTVTTANIDGGTIDGVTLGVSSPITNATIDNININGSAITSTNTNGNISITPNGSGEVDISKVDIDSGTIDNTSIGASNASTGLFTTIGTSGLATLASVDVNGGNIDGTVIGNSTPQTITGTTITANTGFVGGVTGNVTGNLTGNVTGNVTGDLTGDVTGNVTASSGASTFNNVTVNGTLDVTGTTIANVTDPSNAQDAATKNYVDTADALKANINSPSLTGTPLAPTASASTNTTQIATTAFVSTAVSNLVDSAPGTLDTLNELAAALGDDPDFATTITNSIATKLPLAGGTMTGNITLAGAPSANLHPATKAYTDTADALKLNLSGGTMSGAIAMGTSKITGMGDPTSNQDASTKAYTDTQRDTRLALSGGTMSGAIAMGTNKITGAGDPTSAQDVATKNYIDTLFGSTSAAATSASAAATSATASASSATASAASATASANSATAAAASYDQFDDRYLGSKSSAPTVDNDGDALVIGALYFDSTSNSMKVYSSGGWVSAGSSVNGTSNRFDYVVGTNSGSYTDSSTTTFPCTYDAGFVDIYLNGVKLVVGTDVTATSGTNVVLASAAATGDNICIVGYGTFNLASFSVGEANDVDLTGNANNAILAFDTTDSRFEPTLTPTLTSLTTTGNVSVGGNLDVTGSFDMSDANITNIGSIALDTITDDGGTITLDSSGDIILDTGGDDILFKVGGTDFGSITYNNSNLLLKSSVSNGDIIFTGNDGGSSVTALTLDMSEAGRATFNDNVHLGDTKKLVLGAGDDLQIYHDGSNSIISDTGTGGIRIETAGVATSGFYKQGSSPDEAIATFEPDGPVTLYHNNSKKIETTAAGATITGNLGIGSSNYNVHSGTGVVLHATSGGTGSTGSPRLRFTNTTTGEAATDGAELSLDGSTKQFYIENRESEDIILYSGSEKMRVSDAGVVEKTGSNISYVSGSTDYVVYERRHEIQTPNPDESGVNYRDAFTFIVPKSGQLRCRWTAKNQSGSHYWAGRFVVNGSQMKKSDDSTDAIHYFGSSLLPGETSSVHTYKTFQMDLGTVKAGDVIKYQMVDASGGGTPIDGNGQPLFTKEVYFYSTTPSLPSHTTIGTNGVDNSLTIGRPGVDDEGGHKLITQFAAHDVWQDILPAHDDGATGVTFLLNATRTIDQNRHRTALVRYAYNDTFTQISGSEQNTSIEYRVDGNKLQYRFTSAGDYVVNLLVLAAG
jgi:fibronectin-binding autotransporter adhesin